MPGQPCTVTAYVPETGATRIGETLVAPAEAAERP